MLGSIDEDVKVVLGLIDNSPVGHEVVNLSDGLEGGQEAVGASHGVGVGVERNDPAIDEGDLVVSVELLALNLLEVGGVLLGDHTVEEAENVVQAHVVSVANDLVLLSAAPLPDYGLMVESLGHGVDESSQSEAIGPLHSPSDVPNKVSRGSSHVSSLNLVDLVL